MTKSDVGKLIAIFRAGYPGWKPEKATAGVWHRILGDLDYAVVEHVSMQWLATSEGQWPPSVGQLRAAVLEATTPLVLTADEAWAEALQRAGRGRHRPPGDDAIGIACRQVGWARICTAPESEYPSLRNHFRELYQAGVDRLRTTALTTPALGKGNGEATPRLTEL